MELQEQLSQLQTELKTYFDKAKEQEKAFGTVLDDTAAKIVALQKQVDAIDAKMQRPNGGLRRDDKSFTEILKGSDELQAMIQGGSKSALINFPDLDIDSFAQKAREEKTLITSTAVGSATSGVLLFDRLPGIVPLAMRRLRLRQLFSAAPTDKNAIDFVKVNTFSKVVSPQTEGSAKGESEMTFTTSSVGVKTIATWIPATVQILEDMQGLQQLLTESLVYALEEEIEDQILSGDNTGNNLNGLTTQATAFDTTLTVASDGWEKVDLVGRAVQQINAANEVPPDFVVLHPTDYWGMRLIKDTTGRYVFDRPDGAVSFSPIWGLTPIVTTAITAGYFLVGSSAPNVASIRNRTGINVDISREHDDYFIKNKVAIRVETRMTLVVQRPAAFIYGALDTSPA